jgi:hypothetical protein
MKKQILYIKRKSPTLTSFFKLLAPSVKTTAPISRAFSLYSLKGISTAQIPSI